MSDAILLHMFIEGNNPGQLSYNGKNIKTFIVSEDVFSKLVKAFGSSGDKNGLETIMSKMIKKKELAVQIASNGVVSFLKGEYEFMGIAMATENGYYAVHLQAF